MWRNLKLLKAINITLTAVLLWHFGGGTIYAQARPKAKQQEAARISSIIAAGGSKNFDALLGELKDVVKQGSTKTKASPEQGFAGLDRVTAIKAKLVAEHEKNQTYFNALESLIKDKGLGAEMLNRHRQFVGEYEAKYKALGVNLDGIESAHKDATGLLGKLTGRNQKVDWDGPINKALSFIDANTPKLTKRSFDPHNLPHRSLKSDSPIQPKLTRAEWDKALPTDLADSLDSAKANRSEERTPELLGAHASGMERAHASPRRQPVTANASTLLGTTAPAPADLAETIEVKFTPEIKTLADSLEKNPVKIYNWVRNNIEFVPTWGSIQGAQLCLENRAGNAFDTSSLLISLLRYSGIPARYQMGTIEVPIDKFKNWAGGFTNAEAAASLFASAGVPSVVRRVNQSGQVMSVRLEHIWVKAFVDYSPSGGVVNVRGNTWVEMDASFKLHSFPPPVDLAQFTALGAGDGQALLNRLLAPSTVNQNTNEVTGLDLAHLISVMTPNESGATEFVNTTHSQKSIKDLVGSKRISGVNLSLAAARLPYRLLVTGPGFHEVPPSLRHSLSITVSEQPDGNPNLSFTRSLPELARTRIVLGYAPATEIDLQALSALVPADPHQPLLRTIPTNFINLKSELKIDNQVVSGGAPARMGVPQVLRVEFTAPTIQTPAIVNDITAGENYAVALDLQEASTAMLGDIATRFRRIANEISTHPDNPDISLRELQDLVLGSVASGWFRQIDPINQLAAQMFGVVSIRYPSAAMAFSDLRPSSLFGAPHLVTFGSIGVDVDRDIVVTLAKDGVQLAASHHGFVVGIIGSNLEGNVPAQLMHSAGDRKTAWLSTTSAISFAQSLGGTTVSLTPTSFPGVANRLDLAPADRQDIEDALNAGMSVTTHEKQLRDGGGNQFTGYIKLDLQTGGAAYLIGGTSGGHALQCIASDNPLFPVPPLLSNILSNAAFDGMKDGIKNMLNSVGGAGNLVGNLLTLTNVVTSFLGNLSLYETAFASLGNSARPLLGLVLMLAALDVFKEILGLASLVGTGPGYVLTAYVSTISHTATRLVELFVNRMVLIEAVAQGINIPPDCLNER